MRLFKKVILTMCIQLYSHISFRVLHTLYILTDELLVDKNHASLTWFFPISKQALRILQVHSVCTRYKANLSFLSAEEDWELLVILGNY